MNEQEIDYGSWLTEDLRELYKHTIWERDRAEVYSDRAALNQQALRVRAEIQKRNDNE
jgi:hypothetical protein